MAKISNFDVSTTRGRPPLPVDKSDYQRINQGHIRGQNINQIFGAVISKMLYTKTTRLFPNPNSKDAK
ncbi:hypothetical protein DERF_004341 [Dermatophagoides farinae]|uniref:Uncharacterized protein n=1 Tax=Dermatophagoides farinae TaxID=6954 RepID=A0A922I4S2_DERFA|nr:hypothetical protein DERF_004341 [Dermatophagoides farinae]